jgi:hypothetical protein
MSLSEGTEAGESKGIVRALVNALTGPKRTPGVGSKGTERQSSPASMGKPTSTENVTLAGSGSENDFGPGSDVSLFREHLRENPLGLGLGPDVSLEHLRGSPSDITEKTGENSFQSFDVSQTKH